MLLKNGLLRRIIKTNTQDDRLRRTISGEGLGEYHVHSKGEDPDLAG